MMGMCRGKVVVRCYWPCYNPKYHFVSWYNSSVGDKCSFQDISGTTVFHINLCQP